MTRTPRLSFGCKKVRIFAIPLNGFYVAEKLRCLDRAAVANCQEIAFRPISAARACGVVEGRAKETTMRDV